MENNILLNKLPCITPNKFKINTDFRTSIKFELLMQNKKIDIKESVALALGLYFNVDEIDDINKAIEDMLWFYKCGKNEELANSKRKKDNKITQVYSYEFDDNYIYSAFLQQYNIDLNTIKYLHWWKFKALFEGLNKNTKIVEIMGYRGIDLGKIKDKESKKYYKEMKNMYKLPDMRSKEEKESDFAKAFW